MNLSPTAVKTANYSAAVGELVLVDVTGTTGFRISLPQSGRTVGDLVGVEVVAANAGNTNLCYSVGDQSVAPMLAPDTIQISGSGFPIANILQNLYDCIVYQWDGTTWNVFFDNRNYCDRQHVTVSTSTYTASSGQNIQVTASVDSTIALPTYSNRLGDKISVTNASTKVCTVSGSIYSRDGSTASFILYLQGESVTFESSAVGWNVVVDGRISQGAQISNSSSPTIASGTIGLDVPFTYSNFNRGGLADTNNNRITIVRAGVYNVSGSLSYESVTANAAKFCQAILKVNGVNTVFTQLATSLTSMRLAVSAPISLAAGDHLTLGAYQNTGSTLTVSNTDPPKLSAVEVR